MTAVAWRKAFRLLTIVMLGVGALLTVFPGLDLWTMSLFYDEAAGAWVQRSNLMQFARSGMPPLIIGVLLFAVVMGVAGRFIGQRIWDISGRKIMFLLVSLSLGPGLFIESILKSYWGRARPRDVVPFGGDDPFTPAVWIADSCARNCSFVSGHAGLAFWTTAFAFLLPAPHRAPVFCAGLCLGGLMGLARMAEGAHFLSDVLFAGLIVVGLNVWLAKRLLSEPLVPEEPDGA